MCEIERDALHREVARRSGHTLTRYAHDPMGRLLRQHAVQQSAHAKDGPVLVERDYAYDSAGQLAQRIDGLRGRQDFEHDPTGRILGVSGKHTEQFAFDPAGNLLELQPETGFTSAPLPDNRVHQYGDVSLAYDIHGNVVRRHTPQQDTELQWDASHQLREVRVTRHRVTQSTTYDYDALGRRIRKADAFGSTEYLWDGDLMIQSRRGGKDSLFLYEPHSFVPLATVQHDHIYAYHCDQVGMPLELTDEQGCVVWAAQASTWGELAWVRTGTYDGAIPAPQTVDTPHPAVEQPLRFQGQYFDEETGLHYNRFRYYDPQVGRYCSQDPMGLDGGLHRYRYGDDQPFILIDPKGLQTIPTSPGNASASLLLDSIGMDANSLVAQILILPCVAKECQRRCSQSPPWTPPAHDWNSVCMAEYSSLPRDAQRGLATATRIIGGSEAYVIGDCATTLRKIFPSPDKNPCKCQ